MRSRASDPKLAPMRRRLLAAAGLAVLPAWAAASPTRPSDARPREEILADLLRDERSLWALRQTSSRRDEMRITYWTAQQGFDRDQYLQLCWLLRDAQTGRVFPIDRGLLDVLCGIQAWLARDGHVAPLRIHSGYRSQTTNRQTEGAALDSLHVLGKAADVAIDGVTNTKLAGIASLLGRGGTGYYPGRSFVHVDVGDERVWVGPGKKAS